MPIHLTSASSKPVPHRRLVAPFNIMRSLSLCRKSRPTCTLSLAHVSACKSSQDGEAMQVDTLQLDLNTIHFVAVPPPPPKSIRRTTKTNIKTKTTPNDINVIPFPTSAQTTTTSSPTQKRQQFQKKEQSERPVSSSISPPRKRARKDSLTTTTTSPQTSSRSSPSPRARALAQRVPPPRPSTPTPSDSDEMETQNVATDKHAVQPDLQAAQRHQKTSQGEQGQTELPPYSPSPPPYSPLVVASPTPIPLHIPIAVTPSSPPPSIPANSTTPSSSPPLPSPSPSPPPPQRRQRIPSSELKFLIFLYRSLVSGLESRQQNRPHTQVRRARDGSRREQHLDGVLIEVDDDEEDDIDAAAAAHSPVAMDTTTTTPSTTNGLTPSSLNEDLDVQDALLALRLRGFLKWNGVDEWMLRVDDSPPPSPPTSPPPPSTTTTNPFLDEGSPDSKMDVDVVQTVTSSIPQPPSPPPPSPSPILSSRHLVTVLRMRGTCASSSGGRQGIGLGVKNRREKSKLGVCCYQAGDDNVMYDL